MREMAWITGFMGRAVYHKSVRFDPNQLNHKVLILVKLCICQTVYV